MLSLKVALEIAGRCWWIAPNFPQASAAWRELKALAAQIPERKVYEDQRRIVLPGGGEIALKSADAPESLRGEGLDLVVLDEAAYIDSEVWTDAIRPALSDRKGSALIISTPAGYNWFFEAYERGQEGRSDWQSWQYPTSDNPLIDPEEIEAARESLPARTFGQEYLAAFTAGGALFLREWLPIVPAAPALATRVRYWDHASGLTDGADYTAGVLMSRDAHGVYFVEDVVRGRWASFQRDTVMQQTAALDAQRYGKVPIWIEMVFGLGQEAAQQAVRALAGYSVSTERVTKTKVERADPLASQAGAGNVKVVKGAWNSEYIHELLSFPGGKHDDMVDASAGAFHKLAFTEVKVHTPPRVANRFAESGIAAGGQRGRTRNRWNDL